MRQQYLNEYTDGDILAFYKIAANKFNFKNVCVNSENIENNYLLSNDKRQHLLDLYNNHDISNDSFSQVLDMLSDDELIYIGF